MTVGMVAREHLLGSYPKHTCNSLSVIQKPGLIMIYNYSSL